MTFDANRPRTYRFGQRDRTGWLLGLQAVQCLMLASGVLLAGVVLTAGAPFLVVLLPVVFAAGLAFGRRRDTPIYELAPTLLAARLAGATGRLQWNADAPRHRQGSPGLQPVLPPTLDGHSIRETTVEPRTDVPGRIANPAIIYDHRDHTISAVLRVRGHAFSLQERDEQERLLQGWGDALAAFCVERGPVVRVRWLEWAGPTALIDQHAYLAEHAAAARSSEAVDAYRELLIRAALDATRHEALVVITVDQRRVGRRAGRDRDESVVAEAALIEETRLLTARLETAGLIVDKPLPPREVALSWRLRLDPYRAPGTRPQQRHSLVELAGLTIGNAGPLSVQVHYDHVRVDSALHAAYVVAEWPRFDVPPSWMEPLLLHAGGVRTIAVHYEPVAPSRARRAVERDSVRLATDEEQRARSGFRIGARHHRAQADVRDREAELLAGYGELEFTGFVVVTARDVESLEASCAEYEQIAAQCGLELRRLDGRHDLALACMLPVGRGLAPRRFR